MTKIFGSRIYFPLIKNENKPFQEGDETLHRFHAHLSIGTVGLLWFFNDGFYDHRPGKRNTKAQGVAIWPPLDMRS
jgi:hypothetical protein